MPTYLHLHRRACMANKSKSLRLSDCYLFIRIVVPFNSICADFDLFVGGPQFHSLEIQGCSIGVHIIRALKKLRLPPPTQISLCTAIHPSIHSSSVLHNWLIFHSNGKKVTLVRFDILLHLIITANQLTNLRRVVNEWCPFGNASR